MHESRFINPYTHERQTLDNMVAQRKTGILNQVEGVSVVRKRLNNDPFVWPFNLPPRAAMHRTLELGASPQVTDPKAGDFVLYYSNRNPLPAVVGILQEDGLVMSKWGQQGPVVKHPPSILPSSYGERFKVVRDPRG